MSEYSKTIAVDFDGCLCTNKWPDIGDPNWIAIHELIRRRAWGDKVILWTCRTGQQLEDAVNWCMNRGLHFDAVNENLPENIRFFGNDCRKVYANEYWDDKSVPVTAVYNAITNDRFLGRIFEISNPAKESFVRRIIRRIRNE